jgi:uncharacterized protein (DUF488 family)
VAYRRYPYYALRSEIAERVLAGDIATMKAINAARPCATRAGLFTIGYEGRTLEDYLNCLIRNGITLLCDVRRNPFSRKYGFSRKTLSSTCASLSIKYEHMPELGVASECRQSLETEADYVAFFKAYKQDTLAQQPESLSKIRRWVDSGERVALTCYERLPAQCHRHCVAEALHLQREWAHQTRHL